jgi:hypothetical protein
MDAEEDLESNRRTRYQAGKPNEPMTIENLFEYLNKAVKKYEVGRMISFVFDFESDEQIDRFHGDPRFFELFGACEAEKDRFIPHRFKWYAPIQHNA